MCPPGCYVISVLHHLGSSTHALIMTICTEQQACIDMTSQWVHISLCSHQQDTYTEVVSCALTGLFLCGQPHSTWREGVMALQQFVSPHCGLSAGPITVQCSVTWKSRVQQGHKFYFGDCCHLYHCWGM